MASPSRCKLYTDVTTLPEKDRISPQSLQREAQGGQVSEEGNGIVWTENVQEGEGNSTSFKCKKADVHHGLNDGITRI